MTDAKTLIKTIAEIPIVFDPRTERFEAQIGRQTVRRSRLRELEKILTDLQYQTPVNALMVDHEPKTRAYDGGRHTGIETIQITGYRNSRFRVGERAEREYHGQTPYRFDAGLKARLEEIARQSIADAERHRTAWTAELAKAEKLTPDDLTAARDPTR